MRAQSLFAVPPAVAGGAVDVIAVDPWVLLVVARQQPAQRLPPKAPPATAGGSVHCAGTPRHLPLPQVVLRQPQLQHQHRHNPVPTSPPTAQPAITTPLQHQSSGSANCNILMGHGCSCSFWVFRHFSQHTYCVLPPSQGRVKRVPSF